MHGQEIESPAAFRAKSLLARHRYFENLPSDNRVFEFGVGTGVNLAQLEVAERAGFDISETAAELSRQQGITVFPDQQSVPRGHFDVVVCRHVLEHVPDPTQVLDYLSATLAPGGRLLLILPVESRPRHMRRLPEKDVNQHLFNWKLNHIANLLRVCGMEVESFTYQWYSMQRILRFMPDRFGVRAYHSAVALAGRLRRQSEMVVWARQTRPSTVRDERRS
ncbi:MAG: class I SAM-dependent methyltransferase [Acidimicrobiia bacterium]|nr:class I SAM-dependent methyltransferase [Acidimicrobiia bacterium]